MKAANLATLRSFGFSEGTVPNGFAVPFYFYDEFMKHNGFYKYATDLLSNPEFQKVRNTQIASLDQFRSLITKGKMPAWMMRALSENASNVSSGTVDPLPFKHEQRRFAGL